MCIAKRQRRRARQLLSKMRVINDLKQYYLHHLRASALTNYITSQRARRVLSSLKLYFMTHSCQQSIQDKSREVSLKLVLSRLQSDAVNKVIKRKQ